MIINIIAVPATLSAINSIDNYQLNYTFSMMIVMYSIYNIYINIYVYIYIYIYIYTYTTIGDALWAACAADAGLQAVTRAWNRK